MARKSSPKDGVTQMYDTGCSLRPYNMFNFRERQVNKRFVSHRSHSNIHAIGSGNSKSRPDVLTIFDENYSQNHIDVSSKRTRGYGFKSISCVKNDQVAAVQGNEAAKMVEDQNFINGNYLSKDGAASQPHQLVDTLHILYSNKELFLKLLQDPNSLLVKQIYDSQISQAKEECEAGPNMLAGSAYDSRWINSPKSYATQCETPYDGCHCPLHSHDTLSYSEQTAKPSHSPFSHIKRMLRHAIGARKKEQQDLKKKRDKMMKIKDFTSCIGHGAVSVSESCGRNISRTSVNTSEQNVLNIHVGATKNQSGILNCRIEETNINEPTVNIRSPSYSNLHADCGFPIGSEKLIRSDCDLHPGEVRHTDSPTQSFDMDITAERIGFVMDSPQEIQDPNFSPEVASSSSSCSYQSVDNPVNIRNTVDEHLSTESVLKTFILEEFNNPPCTISHPAELPVEVVHDKYEEHHFAWDPMENLITSLDSSESESDYYRGILQTLSLKWDEMVMKCESSSDPSTFEELKGLTSQECEDTILFDCVKEVFLEIYQNFCRFPLQCSAIKPNVQAYVLKRRMVNDVKQVINLHHQHHQSLRTLEQLVEKDLARRGSWLNVQVDAQDFALEVEEHVLQSLILEFVSEMDIRSLSRRCI